jgi:uridine kinase
MFSFSSSELELYLNEYKSSGYPPVRHSEIYREAYTPAYRVIDSRYARILDLLFAIHRKMKEVPRVVVAIDGRCASGKTTIAQYIEQIFEAETIHMDDFFLPGPMRTPERMQEIGGNLHRERFIEEVLPYLQQESFSYRVFQCSTFTYADEPRLIRNTPLRICEGSYSLHQAFGAYYDIAVFSDVEPTEQLRRIRERNG